MQPEQSKPGLYGIEPENSSRSGSNLWGKNQFNSTFPLALCLYMRDRGINPMSIRMVDGEISASDDVWEMREIVGLVDELPYYQFEKKFQPFKELMRDTSEPIDLVVCRNGIPSCALELKLTVVPDNATANLPEDEWAPELVLRPVSSAHAMMGVAASLMVPENEFNKKRVVDTLRHVYNRVNDWDNKIEISKFASEINSALLETLEICEGIQRPFLVQPIWCTKGQSLELSEHCLDVFVWSDVAVLGIPTLECSGSNKIGRMSREVARHVRALYEVLHMGDYNYSSIYQGMPLGSQTGKSFSINGKISLKYLKHERLTRPVIPRSVLADIILNEGESRLKPERRFDVALLLNRSKRRSPGSS